MLCIIDDAKQALRVLKPDFSEALGVKESKDIANKDAVMKRLMTHKSESKSPKSKRPAWLHSPSAYTGKTMRGQFSTVMGQSNVY